MRSILALMLCVLLPCSAWAAFPTNGVLDDFNRADENPLATAGSLGAPIFSTTGTCKLSSNTVMDDALADGSGSCAFYWDGANFGPGVEAYIKVNTPWQNNSSDFWLWMNGNAEGGASVDGYQLHTSYNTGTWYYNVYRFDNAVATELTPSFEAGPTLADGDQIGGEINSGSIKFMYKAAAGAWGTASGVSARSDSTYTSGHIGASKGFQDVTSSLDNFGGGTISGPDSGCDRLKLEDNASYILAENLDFLTLESGTCGAAPVVVPLQMMLGLGL